MLTESQIVEFVQRGYTVVPEAVPEDLLEKAAQRVDHINADDPPAADKQGAHFHFLETKCEPDLLATLTHSPAFDLAEELAGPGSLDIPWQVQIALNIPPYSHRPGGPHIDAANSEPTSGPVRGTFTMLAGILMTDQLTENCGNLWVWPGTHLLGHNIGGNYESDQTRRALYFRLSNTKHASRQEKFLQDVWLEYEPLQSRIAEAGPWRLRRNEQPTERLHTPRSARP